MQYSFEDLIERFGAPKIVVPNTPRILYDGGGSFRVGIDPAIETSAKVYHRRFKHGESEFLAIRSRIEVYLSEENDLLARLRARDLRPVEFAYFYKGTRTWDYSTDSWRESKVAVAIETDVEALSRADLLTAIAEKRVLWIGGWSSMGDKYVDFSICAGDNLPRDCGYHFLFERPARLTEEMLARMGEDYEWEEEFFNCHSGYFTRSFLEDK